jgi:hypothetical protein
MKNVFLKTQKEGMGRLYIKVPENIHSDLVDLLLDYEWEIEPLTSPMWKFQAIKGDPDRDEYGQQLEVDDLTEFEDIYLEERIPDMPSHWMMPKR